MPPRPGRRALALAGSLTLGALLSLLPAAGALPSYADPTPSQSAAPPSSASPGPADEAPAKILVRSLEPRAPTDPEGFFQVTGTITNRGSQPLHQLTVRLRRGEVLHTRGELALADQEPPATGTRIGTPVRAAEQDLPPGGTTTFDLRVRVAQLRLTEGIGVYPLKVEARAVFGADGGVAPVGSVQTLIPWNPDTPSGKVRLAWLWPLVDAPTRGPREVMLNDSLAESLSAGGRLERLLRAAAGGAKGGCDPLPKPPPTLPPPKATSPCRGEPVPITYAVDPDLLFTVREMTKPYLVLASGSKTRRVDNVSPASSWLETLRGVASSSDVLALPYADPDVVALTSASAGLADELPLLKETGRRVTEQVLGTRPLPSVVWPPPGRLTRRAVEALTTGGATALVVDPTALPAPASDPGRTPDTRVGVLPTTASQPTVLTIDPALSALLATQPVDYPGDRLTEQRWLAETAMISYERPSEYRTILVAPPRRADLRSAVAAEAIKDSGRLPWLCPVPLAAVADGSDACLGETHKDSPPLPAVELEPPHPGDPFLSNRYLAQIRALRVASTQFTDEVLAEPTSTAAVQTTQRLQRARGRTESSAWRTDPAMGERMLSLLQDDVRGLRNKVHLQLGSGTVTLTSSTGVISVNVVNELDQPVRVGVQLNARNAARLSTKETPIATLGPGRATQINLKVTAQTSGKFVVTAQLVDRAGNAFNAPQELVVRSTQYGRVALAVTGIAAGVLLVAVGVRIVRRALRRTPA